MRQAEPASKPRPPSGDEGAWQAFVQAGTVQNFYRGWLGVQCRLIAGVVGAVAFRVDDKGALANPPLAAWGNTTRSLVALTDAAQRALVRHERIIVQHIADSGRCYVVAFPVEADSHAVGAVALDLNARPERELHAALRQIEWGSGWLEALALREIRTDRLPGRERLPQVVLDVLASVVGYARFSEAATAFVTEIATRLGCDRVSLGFLSGGCARVRAVSHTADPDVRSNLLRTIGAAMDEAIDQKTPIVYPSDPASAAHVCRAHDELARQGAASCVCTVPFASGDRLVGALTLERAHERPFEPADIEFVEAVTGLAGPGLDVLRREDRWLGVKAVEAARQALARLLGPGHLSFKLTALAVVSVLAFLCFAHGSYRVTAPAVMEGVVRRAVVAPFDGYVREAPVRAGDVLRKGDVLAVLDDRELRLERAKLASQRDQFERQRDLALAEGNAAQINIARAQIEQVLARVALTEDQLGKTRLVASFDGVVVTGDLSQSLGSPVDQGEVLFEIAPLDAYRLVLEVDERDIADVAIGQHGELLLVAAPIEAIPFAVAKIVPVSEAKDGRNFFRVEADVAQAHERLRPGMEGVAKVEIERRRLVAIWMRSVVDWARLALWTWVP